MSDHLSALSSDCVSRPQLERILHCFTDIVTLYVAVKLSRWVDGDGVRHNGDTAVDGTRR
jgi:hypothetical protein